MPENVNIVKSNSNDLDADYDGITKINVIDWLLKDD